jgi:hypothetical protein
MRISIRLKIPMTGIHILMNGLRSILPTFPSFLEGDGQTRVRFPHPR